MYITLIFIQKLLAYVVAWEPQLSIQRPKLIFRAETATLNCCPSDKMTTPKSLQWKTAKRAHGLDKVKPCLEMPVFAVVLEWGESLVWGTRLSDSCLQSGLSQCPAVSEAVSLSWCFPVAVVVPPSSRENLTCACCPEILLGFCTCIRCFILIHLPLVIQLLPWSYLLTDKSLNNRVLTSLTLLQKGIQRHPTLCLRHYREQPWVCVDIVPRKDHSWFPRVECEELPGQHHNL